MHKSITNISQHEAEYLLKKNIRIKKIYKINFKNDDFNVGLLWGLNTF